MDQSTLIKLTALGKYTQQACWQITWHVVLCDRQKRVYQCGDKTKVLVEIMP